MLTPWGIQTGLSSSTPAPGQDAASAESLESLPTLLPGLPWLLIPTDGPALLQAPQTPLGGSPPPRSGQQVVRAVTYQRPAGTLRRHVTGNGARETLRARKEKASDGWGGTLRPPAAQCHSGWGPGRRLAPSQTPSACLLLPPSSAAPGLGRGLSGRVQGRVCVWLQSSPPRPGPAGSARSSGSR